MYGRTNGIRGNLTDSLAYPQTDILEQPFRCSDLSSSAHLRHENICIQDEDEDDNGGDNDMYRQALQ